MSPVSFGLHSTYMKLNSDQYADNITQIPKGTID